MSRIDIEDIEIDKLNIKVRDTDDSIKVMVSGLLDMEYPSETVFPYFQEIHNKILEAKLKHIEIYVTELEYINSSGIRTFLMWLNRINKEPEENRYKIKFIYSKNTHWHTSIFPTFRKINDDLIETQEV